jgi:hypothetical protein
MKFLKKAEIQLSIYSTTFYDAAGYNVANFALVDAITHATYIREMIDEKVAHPISFNQDPIALFHSLPQGGMLERKIIYDSFPTSEVEGWFKNHLNR